MEKGRMERWGIGGRVKILYISGGMGADYMCDSLFHGLRYLFGTDVVDIFPLRHMYKDSITASLYGRGFTLFGLIEEGQVDRTDIPAKIRNRHFDLVIFAAVQRERSILEEVRESYPPSKIIFIDGEDNPIIYLSDHLDWGTYFKRELHSPQINVHPIQFGFPEEKIQPLREKVQLMAPLDPVDLRTYIYQDEATYYADYGKSLFGKTMKKSGWECLRHLEIMGCRAIPYFVALEHCPETIMTRSPKKELLVAKAMLEYNRGELFLSSSGEYIWEVLEHKIFEHFQKNLTTTAIAKYVLDTVMEKVAA